MTDTTAPLEVGSPAPDFTLPIAGGGEITLSALQGAPVVVYFYPKADTSGCTKQAIGFTEKLAAFEAAGAKIIGVSKDPVSKLEKFRDKHDLGVTLASAAETETVEQYGAWVEKSMYGKKYMGIDRSTFVVGADGTLTAVWRKVKVPGHVDAVLRSVQG